MRKLAIPDRCRPLCLFAMTVVAVCAGATGPHPYLDGEHIPAYVGATNPQETPGLTAYWRLSKLGKAIKAPDKSVIK